MDLAAERLAMNNGKRLFDEIRAQTREERDAFWIDVIKEFQLNIKIQCFKIENYNPNQR